MSTRSEREAAFREAYASLNAAQKEAVGAIEGPVMVVAGPGTGKTQILTLRIANIIRETDAAPENILALTFTENGARAMRERLLSYISTEAYRVNIHTFHGFCERLIRAYPDAYETIIGGRLARELEKVDLVESILEDPSFTALRPRGNPSYYISAIVSELSTLKREYVTPDRLAEILEHEEEVLAATPKFHEKGAHKGKVRSEYQKLEKKLEKNRELLALYRRYDALLRDRALYDYDDMVIQTIQALEHNEDMLRDLQETFQYMLADEHQDVNGSQNRILELLASYHDAPNVFVVGDEKQAIFRFQGASLENFLYFEERFSGTKTIALTDNYRSGQPVLDAAHDLIAVEAGPLAELRVPLTGQTDEASIERRQFVHEAVEDEWLAERVRTLITEGVSEREIAVIVRTNREVEDCAAHLRKLGIHVTASAESDILGHPLTGGVTDLINAATDQRDETALFRVIQAPYWGLAPADAFAVLAGRSYEWPLRKLIFDPDAVRRIGTVLEDARARSVVEPPHRVLEHLLTESGFLPHALKTAPLEAGRVIRRLYDEVEAMVLRNTDGEGATRQAEAAPTLATIAREFTLLRVHGLPLSAPYIATDTNAVSVMTAHKSKGLEFEHVFIPHLVDRRWGGTTSRRTFDIPLTRHIDPSSLDEFDDEKRLLYVAMTRAKRGLYLSHAATNTDGKDFTPSRLLAEIDEKLIPEKDVEEFESRFDPAAALESAAAAPVLPLELFKKTLAERGFSATSLNNYLRSPWEYVFKNVLRIPEIQEPHLQYGTVLHEVMERVTRTHTKKGEWPGTTKISQYLERALARLPLSEEEFTRFHEDGLAALTVYLEHVKGTLPARTKEEFRLEVMLPTGIDALPELPLTGKLDRLDLNEDGRVTRVIDYKTGKPKTRGVIEGTTKDSNGDYKRQLVFYALLLELYGDERYASRECVLSFIEPAANGEVKEYPYTITDEEIESLKAEIIAAVEEICSGEFLTAPCDPKESNYCELVSALMRKDE